MSKGLAAGGYGCLPMDARPFPEPARTVISSAASNWHGSVIIICLGVLAIVLTLAAYGVI